MSALVAKIRSRGHWDITVRPARYMKERIGYEALTGVIADAKVQLQPWGWGFPHTDHHQFPRLYQDSYGREFDLGHFLEAWRFYQSGQFMDVRAIPEDWRDQSDRWPAPQGWEPGQVLGVAHAVWQLTEIFEFAARLSATPAGDSEMHVTVRLAKLAGRQLYSDERERLPFLHTRVTAMPEFVIDRSFGRVELITGAREIAIDEVRELFERFGWSPLPQQLRERQDRLPAVTPGLRICPCCEQPLELRYADIIPEHQRLVSPFFAPPGRPPAQQRCECSGKRWNEMRRAPNT